MPTYEYECRSCSHSFEAFQAMSEDPLDSCPSCGGPVRRLIGAGMGIIFKGSGFYVNDSRKASTAATAPGADSPAKSDSPKDGAAATPASPPSSPPPSADSGKASSAGSSPAPKKEAV